MLTFLNTFLLPALAAAGIPILIHLLNRQKVIKLPFSSLRFLRNLQRTRMRRVKLRQWLLLLLRTLAIALIVLAFTRPAVKGVLTEGIESHSRSSVVIMVDRSYSTQWTRGGGSVLEAEKQRARTLLEFLKPGDDVLLIPFADVPDSIMEGFTHDFEGVQRKLDGLQPSARTTDYRVALQYAVEHLAKSQNLSREIYLLTDPSAGEVRTSGSNAELIPPNMRLFVLPISGDEGNNLGVADLAFPNQLIETGRPVNIEASVKNFGASPEPAVLAGVYLDGERVAQQSIDVSPQQTVRGQFTFTVRKPGLHSGYVELPDDPLPPDNRRYFSFRIPEQVDVLIVGDQRDSYQFLQAALSPDTTSAQFMQVKRIGSDRLGGESLGEYQVVILAGLTGLSDDGLARIRDYVRQGGGLLVTFSRNTSRDFLADISRDLIPADVIGVSSGTSGKGFQTLAQWNFNHPAYAPLGEIAKDKFPTVQVYAYADVQPKPGATVTASLDNRAPAIVEGRYGQGRTIFWTFSPEPTATDLIVSGLFLPLVHRTVQYLSSQVARFDDPVSVGNAVVRPLVGQSALGAVTLVSPANQREVLRTRYEGLTPMIRIPLVEEIGAFSLLDRETAIDRFTVNPVLTESEGLAQGFEGLKRVLPTQRVTYIAEDSDLAKSVLQVRYGRELWKECLVLAFLLLMLEMMLGATWKAPVEEPQHSPESMPMAAA